MAFSSSSRDFPLKSPLFTLFSSRSYSEMKVTRNERCFENTKLLKQSLKVQLAKVGDNYRACLFREVTSTFDFCSS